MQPLHPDIHRVDPGRREAASYLLRADSHPIVSLPVSTAAYPKCGPSRCFGAAADAFGPANARQTITANVVRLIAVRSSATSSYAERRGRRRLRPVADRFRTITVVAKAPGNATVLRIADERGNNSYLRMVVASGAHGTEPPGPGSRDRTGRSERLVEQR